MRQAAAQ
jgi:hypothetical protein